MSLFGKLFGKKDSKAKTEKKKLPEEEDGQVKYMKPKASAEKTSAPAEEKPETKETAPAVKQEAKKETPAPTEKSEPKAAKKKPEENKPAPAEKKPASAPKKDAPAEKKETAPKKTQPEKKAEPTPAPKEKTQAERETEEKHEAEAVALATDEASESVALPTKTGPVGKFDLKKSKDGRFVFNLLAANRVIVATSQIYSSSSAAMNGIHSVIANAEKAPVEDQTLKNYTPIGYPKWEIYLDKGNQYRFRLNASNGSCICHSQGYTTKASCKNGIESIIRTVKDAKTEKSYLKKDENKK